MKTKIILAFLCLCLTDAISAQSFSITDGTYLFEEAQLVIENFDTKATVESKILTDTASIDVNDLHLTNVIFEIEIQDGKPLIFKLSDKKRYKLDEQMMLKPALKEKELAELESKTLEEEYLFIDKELPPYELKMEGEKLVIAFGKYNFGQSSINYTMTASLTVVTTKQK